MYVLLTRPDAWGNGAIFSIVMSALVTGYTSAMIAFDKDVDAQSRKNQPKFYGYIPDENGLRNWCFVYMTIISTLHNLSRSVGCALLAALGGETIVLSFICGEIMLFLVWKIVRSDIMCWFKAEGPLGVLLSVFIKVVVKIVVDFSGCLQFR